MWTLMHMSLFCPFTRKASSARRMRDRGLMDRRKTQEQVANSGTQEVERGKQLGRQLFAHFYRTPQERVKWPHEGTEAIFCCGQSLLPDQNKSLQEAGLQSLSQETATSKWVASGSIIMTKTEPRLLGWVLFLEAPTSWVLVLWVESQVPFIKMERRLSLWGNV